MNTRLVQSAVLIPVLALLAAVLAAPAPPPAAPAFTDITTDSGVEKIVADKYAADPKWWLSGLHLVDLDGDGNLDLFLSGHGTQAVATLGDGKGHFALAPGDYPKTEIHVPYDIDEDGTLDVSMTYMDGGGQWWLNRSKPGALHFEPTDMKRGGNTCRQQAMIDANGDGFVDWLRGTAPGIVFDLADRKGHFVEGSHEIAIEGVGHQDGSAVIPADLDGDGRVDLVASFGAYTYEPCKTRILPGGGGLEYRDATAESGIPQDAFMVKGLGDLDQDGDLDIIAIENQKEFSVWLNDGKGRFTKKEGALPGIGGGINYPYWGLAAVTDFDNDGVADVIMDGRNFLKVLRGTGGGAFEYMNKEWGIRDAATAAVDEGVCFGDIDDDGDLDVLGFKETYPTRTFAVYRNDLPARNWLAVRPVGVSGNAGAAGAKNPRLRARRRQAPLVRAGPDVLQAGRADVLHVRGDRAALRPRRPRDGRRERRVLPVRPDHLGARRQGRHDRRHPRRARRAGGREIGGAMRIKQSVCYPMMKPDDMPLADLFREAARIGYAGGRDVEQGRGFRGGRRAREGARPRRRADVGARDACARG